MANIYENSFLTISAQVARHCNDGFLKPRKRSKYPPFLVPVSRQKEQLLPGKKPTVTNEGSVLIFTPDDLYYARVYRGECFLDTRA